MPIIKMFGIPNCDTIKKAKKWLTENAIDFEFHDYRKQGISKEWLNEAQGALGWENILNKRGTTFRNLTDEQKNNLNEASAIDLMLAAPAMIKRPILVVNSDYYVGFKAATYQTIFSK